MDHEQAFVSAFVVPEKRDRYSGFLCSPKRRHEITKRFNHFFDFVPELAKRTPRCLGSQLFHTLRALGAGETAHVIGGGGDIDGMDLPLAKAIDSSLIAANGAVVSCLPGRLAFLVEEFPAGDIYILRSQP